MWIYRQVENDKDKVVEARKATYNGNSMGERSVTCEVSSPYPVANLGIGCFVELELCNLLVTGKTVKYTERFYIYSDASIKRNSGNGTAGNAFEYTIKLYSEQYLLQHMIEMRDVAISTGSTTPYHTDASEYCLYGNVERLCQGIITVINKYEQSIESNKTGVAKNISSVASYANTTSFPAQGVTTTLYVDEEHGDIYHYSGSQYVKCTDVWNIFIWNDSIASDCYQYNFSSTYVWNALAMVNNEEELDLDFVVIGRTICIGFPSRIVKDSNNTEYQFKYGTNTLYKLNKSVNDGRSIINRLRAYGSTRNIARYYNSTGRDSGRYVPRLMLPSFSENGIDYVENADSKNKYGLREASHNFEDIYPTIQNVRVNDLTFPNEPDGFLGVYTVKIEPISTINLCAAGYFSTYLNGVLTLERRTPASKIEITAHNYTDGFDYVATLENMSIGVFTRKDSTELLDKEDLVAIIDVHISNPQSEYYKTRKDGTYWYAPYCYNANNITTNNPEVNEILAVNVNRNEDDEIVDFDIYIRDLGFDIEEQFFTGGNYVWKWNGTPKFNILDGLLGGLDFDLNDGGFVRLSSSDTHYASGARFKVTLKPNTQNEYSVLPTSELICAAGDHFSIYNVDMPDSYVVWAENRLLVEANKYLNDNCNPEYQYDLEFDKISLVVNANIAAQLREDSILRIYDANLVEGTDYCVDLPVQTMTIEFNGDQTGYNVGTGSSSDGITQANKASAKLAPKIEASQWQATVATVQKTSQQVGALTKSATSGISAIAEHSIFGHTFNGTQDVKGYVEIVNESDETKKRILSTDANGRLSVDGVFNPTGDIIVASNKKIYFGGNTDKYIELTQYGIHTNADFYSDNEITAGGIGSGGGQGGVRYLYMLEDVPDYRNLANKVMMVNASHQIVWSDAPATGVTSVSVNGGSQQTGAVALTIPSAQIQSDWSQSDSSSLDYIKNKPSLASVATSGSYDDLSNKPIIPTAQVNTDWNANSGVAQLLNKPTTLSGYGITDAKIENGVITLGSNTITPLTSHQSLASCAKVGQANNLIHYGNEFTFASPAYSGIIHINYRTSSGSTDGNISNYLLCDGKGGVLFNLSTIASNASNGNTAYGWRNHADAGYLTISAASSTYLPFIGGTMSGEINMGLNRIKFNSSIKNDLIDDRTSGLTTFSISNPESSTVGYIGILSVNDYYKFQLGSYGGDGVNKNTLFYRGYDGNNTSWNNWVRIYHSGNLTKSTLGLGNVENKSSATIRSELTSSNVTTALGYTPYNSTNPNGYITSSGSCNYASYAGNAKTIDSNSLSVSGTTVADYKSALNEAFAGTYGFGYNISVPDGLVNNWSNDSATVTHSSTYSFVKISGAYNGNTYCQFLLTSYENAPIYILGKGYNGWGALKKIYHSGNCNNTTTTWNASSLTLNGAISGATTGSFSGNVSVGGTLSVTSAITANGGIKLSTGQWIESASTGNGLLQNVNDVNMILGTANGNVKVRGTMTVGKVYLNSTNTVYIEYDSNNGAVHCNVPFYSDGEVSAGGIGSGGGGGSSTNLYALNDVYHSGTDILRADGSSKQNGDVLTFNSTQQKWVAASTSHTHTVYLQQVYQENPIVTLGYGNKYQLTAGGSSLVFQMPAAGSWSGGTVISSITPSQTNSINIGSASLYWQNAYIRNISIGYGYFREDSEGNMWAYPNDSFHVGGDIYAGDEDDQYNMYASYFREYSDERKKHIISEKYLSLSEINSMRSVMFNFYGKQNVRYGTIAQDVLQVLPEVVATDKLGYYSLDYGNLAVGLALSLGKIAQTHEDRIAALESQIAALTNELNTLKAS